MEEAGAVDAVKAVVDYCTEHYGLLSFGTGETLKLIQSRVAGGGYATWTGPACWTRRTLPPPTWGTPKRAAAPASHDPRAGPPVVGPGQHV